MRAQISKRQTIFKKCNICKHIKEETEFRKNRLQCKKCLNTRRTLLARTQKSRKHNMMMTKICNICDLNKEETEFNKNRLQCKKCLNSRRSLAIEKLYTQLQNIQIK